MIASDWRVCAIGISINRAGLPVFEDADPGYLAAAIDGLLTDNGDPARMGLVSIATDMRCNSDEPTAVVFPLLALADALEESEARAASAPEESSRSLP